jgi:hypothetical protein
MLSREYAHWLASPSNAIEPVKAAVRQHGGRISELSHGNGVAEVLSYYLEKASF